MHARYFYADIAWTCLNSMFPRKYNSVTCSCVGDGCSVGCNTIGDVGATALADALLVNTTLTAVAVNNNAIGDIGAQALAEVGGQHLRCVAINV
eukprot:m.917682 g.917682  ORF g.917682 m.917682 type:complete len:94 (-) comp23738_c0_seq88:108-389(-)